MAKSAAERKAAQRKRQRDAGIQHRLDLHLDSQEYDMLMRNCAVRRPGRTPYDIVEYLQFLIRKDDAELKKQLAQLGEKKCGKCGEHLPVNECCMSGDTRCWVNSGWHKLKLVVA